MNKQKDSRNEAEYELSSVTHEVLSYFNIFKCGMNILSRLDVTYELSCTATPKKEYYMYLLETMIEHNDCSKTPLLKEKLGQAINMIVTKNGIL